MIRIKLIYHKIIAFCRGEMTYKTKRVMNMRRLLIVMLGLVILVSIGNSLQFSYENSGIATRAQVKAVSHSPIKINSNTQFATLAASEGWPGNGTVGNPYIISDYDINATGYGYGIYIGNVTVYFIIRNCTIYDAVEKSLPYNGGNGIMLYGDNHGIIYNNTIYDNGRHGIYCDYCTGVIIENNTVYKNTNSGIRVDYGGSNIIKGNTVYSNGGYGINLYISSGNKVWDNNLTNDSIALGKRIAFTTQEISTNNTVNGKPVYYYSNVNFNNATLPSDAGEVILGNVTYAIVSGENISNMDVGIFVGFSKNIVIERNNISGFTWYGIYYGFTNYTRIENNTIFNGVTDADGIHLYYSKGNTIYGNNISACTNGVYLQYSDSNEVISNKFNSMSNEAVYVDSSDSSVITNNICTNSYDGIYVYNTYSADIENNTCINISYSAIKVDSSNTVTIKYNLCINSNTGINIYYSSVTVENNNCSFDKYGIYEYTDGWYDDCSISTNTLLNDTYGIYSYVFSSSSKTYITSNEIINTVRGITISGTNFDVSANRFIGGVYAVSNSPVGIEMDVVSNSNIYDNILTSKSGDFLIGWGLSAYQISSTTKIKNNTISYFMIGIEIDYSSGSTIIDNSIMCPLNMSLYGIIIQNSSNIALYSNSFSNTSIMLLGNKNTFTTQRIPTNNTVNGLPVYYFKNADMYNLVFSSSSGEIIIGNITNFVIDSQSIRRGTIGIEIGYSENLNIKNSNITGNIYGIYMVMTNYTVINGCTMSHNMDGLYMINSNNNEITNNTFSNNTRYGIEITEKSSYNQIYSNYFYFNHGSNGTYNASHIQAYDSGTNNSWNSLGRGNYWYDWANNNDTNDQNNDGIVDWPYKIDGGNSEDYFPLKNTTAPTPVPEFNTVYVYCAMLVVLVFVFIQRKRDSKIKIS